MRAASGVNTRYIELDSAAPWRAKLERFLNAPVN